jgi:propanol-preferring alcohol dehydrogenase
MMRAMVLESPRSRLVLRERPLPAPQAVELLIAVAACGVCRSDGTSASASPCCAQT